MQLIHIGDGNYVNPQHVVSVGHRIEKSRQNDFILETANLDDTKSVITTVSGLIITSAYEVSDILSFFDIKEPTRDYAAALHSEPRTINITSERKTPKDFLQT